MTYQDIVAKVAHDNQLSADIVNKIYRAYWKAVRQHIVSLPLKEDLTDEEFMSLRPNINIPSIGKLYVTLDRYHGMKKRFELHYKNYKGKKYKKDNHVEN